MKNFFKKNIILIFISSLLFISFQNYYSNVEIDEPKPFKNYSKIEEHYKFEVSIGFLNIKKVKQYHIYSGIMELSGDGELKKIKNKLTISGDYMPIHLFFISGFGFIFIGLISVGYFINKNKKYFIINSLFLLILSLIYSVI